ncbi:MAG: DNA polymerase III subunit alpha, partial [Candidatus Gastranaerophilales bacterium]|nr:DNA polymerase III subunit alpha [Candidatus Gastranaerophilales bacterium]
NISEELKKRVRYELDVINKMGFAAYFIITWDFIHYAKTHGIPVGPGRGSAAGSVVAYALDITDLDPIKHKLLFERFLNPERFTMPDIDIDFCFERRGEVIDYVTQKYGEDRVCQIITFGTYAAKAAFKGVARILKIPFSESNKLAGLIDSAMDIAQKINDKVKTLGEAIKYEGSELKKMYDADEQIITDTPGKTIGFKKLIDLAVGIEGLKNNTGTHAAGVIIAPKPLDEILPVQPSKDGIIQTGYPPHDVTEVLSLLKMDFLGLRNLTTIYKTVDLIEKRQGIKVDINNIPLDDKPTYDMLIEAKTEGVFQLESDGMKALVKKLRPDVFEDLGALVALFRPGPLDSGMIDDFVERKHGRQKITYAHPLLEPILKDTYGTIVYQEQIMQVFQVLADYTLGQADQVRRMMGKKKVDEMEQQRAKFIEKSAAHDMSAKDAEALFEQILSFASYCFNRSHSAAYAFVAYQTAYLKRHYPVEYMAMLLSSVSNDQAKTQSYISSCQDMGIKILPPDINNSDLVFTPDGDDIRFGLISIKGLGEIAIKQIIEERDKNGSYKDIADFATRLDTKCVNRKTLESLCKSGAFDSFGATRRQLFENIDNIINLCQKENSAKQTGQVSLFSTMDESFYKSSFRLDGEEKEFSDTEIQEFEKDILGFYVTSHPLSSIKDKLPFLTTHTIANIIETQPKKTVTICGLVSGVRIVSYKNPAKFLKAGTIEDLTGNIEFKVFYNDLFPKGKEPINEFIESGRKLILTGI